MHKGRLFQQAVSIHTYLHRAELDIQDINKEIDRQSQRQMPIRHSYFLYLVVLTRESNLLMEKTSPKNSFFRLIGETHTWTPSLILIAPSHVCPNVDFYIMAKTMDSSISVL